MATRSQFETYPEDNPPAADLSSGIGPKPELVLFPPPAQELPSAGEQDNATGLAGGLCSGEEDTYVFPASREQTRYWMLAQLDPTSTASNMAIAFEVEGPLSDTVVEQAMAALTLRHEALRTIFRLEAGLLSQVVVARPLYRFSVLDLAHLPDQEQPRVLEAAVSRHGHTIINLETGPVLHALLIHLEAGRHVIALTMNHIVCDGWSNGILIRDFTVLYEALLAGREAVLPELPFQFADFSLWQSEYLISPAADEAAAFWKAHITSDLPALDMPTDHARPSGRSFPGHIESELLPKAIDDQLKAYCRRTGSTKHIVLLAAFEAFCARYTGQKEFFLGSTIANRTQPGMEDVVGRFANPQIIVARVEGDPTFAELEKRVRDWEMAAYTHQDLPFSRIIEDFQVDQAGATSQFLQVWFLYQKAFMQPQKGATIEVKPRRSVSGGVDFDLLVSVVERAEGPRIQFEYNTLIFEPARIRGLIEGLIALLGSALEEPGRPMSEIGARAVPRASFVQAASRVLAEPEATELQAKGLTGADAGFLSRLAAHAAAHPQQAAITDRAATLNWQDLDRQSSALAGHLQTDAGSRLASIAIHLTPGVESLVALVAAMKAGARILPFPVQAESRSMTECLRGSEPAILLASRTVLAGMLAGTAPKTIAFEDFSAMADEQALAAVKPVGPESRSQFVFLTDAAHSAFVEIDEASLFLTVSALATRLGIEPGGSLLSLPAPTPIDACLDLLLGLATGAHLVLGTELAGAAAGGLLVGRLVAEQEVSCILATPTEAKMWLGGAGWAGDRRVTLALRGERLPATLAPMLTLRLKTAVYLLTSPRAGGYAALQVLTGAPPVLEGLGGSALCLCDSAGQTLPAGAFGEICVCLERRENPGARLLPSAVVETGMMGRSSSSGSIEMQDRVDRFVQLRGHRVCLGDIEDALFRLPSIGRAAVALVGEEASTGHAAVLGEGARLLVYLTAPAEPQAERRAERSPAAPAVDVVRQHLAASLPSHLLPSEFIWLDTFPLAADGRLAIERLPQREKPVTAVAEIQQARPLNETEARLASIWKDVLGLKSVDPHKSFFELGGSSLLLVRLFARVNKAFETALPITTIFDAQTVAAMAVTLGGGSAMSHLVQVQTAGSKPPLFMIHSYLLYQGLSRNLGPDQPFYGLRELEQDGHLTIEQRVRHYVDEIRRVQPQGPYHLAGWCAAGPLTVEVGRQLLNSGQRVNYLALFDSWRPGYLEALEQEQGAAAWQQYRTFGSKVHYHRHRMRGLTWQQRGHYLWLAATRITRETKYRIYLRNWERVRRWSEKYKFALPQFMHNTSLETFSALKEYQGQSVPVRMTLIRASDSREIHGASSSCGWEQIAKDGVDVLWAPGDHETMFVGEYLKATSEIVRHGLEAAAGAGHAGVVSPDNMVVDETGAHRNALRGGIHVDCPST